MRNNWLRPAFLLRSASLIFAILGVSISVWLIDNAFQHPEIRATQGEASAPLWIPMMLFVVAFTAAAIVIFLRAARRLDRGEDLFSHRHRKAPWEA